MGIKKNIKAYFNRKKRLSELKTESVRNFDLYDTSKKTIVFFSTSFPTHDKDSGSNRHKEIIFLFRKLKYNCIVAVENVFEDNKYVDFYTENNCIVFVENTKLCFWDFIKKIPKVDFLWFNGPLSFDRYFEKSKKITGAKAIFDMVDVHFLRFKRAIDLEPTRISLRKNHAKFLKIETKLAKKADYVVTISEKEEKLMCQLLPNNKIITISNIHYLKTDKHLRLPFEERKDLLFVGSIHEPNIDALNFLYQKIMPKIWLEKPEIKVNVVGNLIEKINVSHYPEFNFLGYVEDMEPLLKSSKIMIAPLRFGAGVKGKIGQAFEYFLPVVTTNIGAEGMQLIRDEYALIEDDPSEFAKAVINLYSNETLWNKLSDNSQKSLHPFSREAVENILKNLN